MSNQEVSEIPICDVCGKPATNSARDVYIQDVGLQRLNSPGLHIRMGCDDHEAESRYFDVTPCLPQDIKLIPDEDLPTLSDLKGIIPQSEYAESIRRIREMRDGFV